MISLEKSNFTAISSLLLEVSLVISTMGEQSGTTWRHDLFWTDNHIRQWQDSLIVFSNQTNYVGKTSQLGYTVLYLKQRKPTAS